MLSFVGLVVDANKFLQPMLPDSYKKRAGYGSCVENGVKNVFKKNTRGENFKTDGNEWEKHFAYHRNRGIRKGFNWSVSYNTEGST